MVKLLRCTRTRACSNNSLMMVMLTNMMAQMHPCKNLWKTLQASCPSKTLQMSLLQLCQQRSRIWTEVRLSNHLAKPLRILLQFNLLKLCKRLLKQPRIRRKRTILVSRPNRTLLQPNKNNQLNLVTRSKKKLSQVQKLLLPTSNEKKYLRPPLL